MPQKPSAKPLSGEAATLVLSLYARARESRRAEALFEDPWAVRALAEFATDFEPEKSDLWLLVCSAVRTKVIDELASAFLVRRPEARVVNLGAGLCTRFFRVDTGRLTWHDVDLPDVTGSPAPR